MNYFLYCRKSTDEADRQVLSIEAQKAELQEFAVKEQLNIVETLIESQTFKAFKDETAAKSFRLKCVGLSAVGGNFGCF